MRQLQARDTSIMTQIEQQAGSNAEFEQLLHTVRRTPEQQQRFEVMLQWRQVAGPIFERAQTQVIRAWDTAFKAAAEFDGMSDEARQTIMKATDAKQALETIHAAGVAAGERKAEREISRLKAEVASLKTRQVASRPQPAGADGLGAPAGRRLPSMLLEDGSLNPEFEALASSGKLYGAERLT